MDAALNLWFLHIVKQRLVRYHGLAKYKPLVRFNARLMILSVGMDVRGSFIQALQSSYLTFHCVDPSNWPHVSQKSIGLYTIPPGCIHDQAQH